MKTQSLDEQNYEVSKLPETEKRKLLKEHEDLVQQREEVFKQQFLSDDWLKQNPNCSFKDIAKSISSTYEETLASIDPDFVILVLKLHSIRKFSNPKRPMVDYSGAFKTKAIKEVGSLGSIDFFLFSTFRSSDDSRIMIYPSILSTLK